MGLQFSPFESFIGANSRWAADILPLHVTTFCCWLDLKIISGLIYFYGLLKLFSHLISIMEDRVVQSPYSGEIFENVSIFHGNLLLNVINLEAFLQYCASLEAVIREEFSLSRSINYANLIG